MSYGNMITKKIYFHSPGFIKNIFATVYGYIQIHKRYGSYFENYLKFLRESQFWDNSDLIKYRDIKAIEFVNFAIKHSAFYEDNCPVNDINEIKKFPIIDKQIVRRNTREIIPRNIKEFKYKFSHTSGTTGSSLIFPITYESFQREYAFRALHYQWSGVDLKKKPRIAIFAGHPVARPDRRKPPFWVKDYANNWLIFSSYHLSVENLKIYIKKLIDFDPELIHGYPSTIYLLSLVFKQYGHKMKSLKSVYTASETLLDYQRKSIEDSFQVKVFNWYGNSEMCANIVECELGELHLKLEHSFVEILNDKNEEAKPGEEGRLVCTGFGNYAFPLIRYDIKDIVRLSKNQKSKCGRGGIIIEEIIGRVEDYVVTPDGRYIGRLDHIFKDSVNVREAQLIQKDVNELLIRIVPEKGYSSEDEKKIFDEVKLRLGSSMRIRIEYVDKIEREKNGKFKFVINEVLNANKLSV
jgi:phenylacetate-CoA ligase